MKKSGFRKWVIRIIGISVMLVGLVLIAFSVSPRPGVLIIRSLFDAGSRKVSTSIEQFAPVSMGSMTNIAYRDNDPAAKLDVFFPELLVKNGQRLPAVIWIHGGAWISGSRTDMTPYYKRFANEGFVVIPIDYTIAPDANYPTPVLQSNDAIRFVIENAERFHVDTERIFVAGDSAGAQIASQIGLINSDPEYAHSMNTTPATKPEQLRGLILHCGFYDLEKFAATADISPVRFLRWGMTTMLWAYMGTRTPDPAKFKQMSALKHAGPKYPAVFISGGNGDPLTDAFSKPFAEKLKSQAVPVTELFFPADHVPSLSHEYQFELELEPAKKAMTAMSEFIRERSK